MSDPLFHLILIFISLKTEKLRKKNAWGGNFNFLLLSPFLSVHRIEQDWSRSLAVSDIILWDLKKIWDWSLFLFCFTFKSNDCSWELWTEGQSLLYWNRGDLLPPIQLIPKRSCSLAVILLGGWARVSQGNSHAAEVLWYASQKLALLNC